MEDLVIPERGDQTYDAQPSQREIDSLRSALERCTGALLQLTITRNRSTMISVKGDLAMGTLNIRLHKMFLAAPPAVVEVLGKWIAGDRRNQTEEILNRYIRTHSRQSPLPPPRPRRVILRTRGHFVDLAELFDEVNREQFGNRIAAAITWGKRSNAKRQRTIRLGSYALRDRIIRIHPVLDQKFVPRYVVKYIVFHEMLHAELGATRSRNGQRRYHTPEFRARERAYPDFARASTWLEDPKNMANLLGRRRPAKRMKIDMD